MSGSIINRLRKLWQRNKLNNILNNGDEVKLHLGCGDDYLVGYVNIDSNPKSKADLYLDAHDLSLFPDNSVDRIESYHFFEHLDYYRAKMALREWFRILKPKSLLILELPNLDVCIREIGKHYNEKGIDLAMVGIYGYPPDIARSGITQIHKWGWSPSSIERELVSVGFTDIHEHEVRQRYREAASFGRDMQIRAMVP